MFRTARKRLLILLALCMAIPAFSQSIIGQLEVPGTPGSIAVDPFLNRIYVAQINWDMSNGNTYFSVIDGSSNKVVQDEFWFPDTPGDLAVDYVSGNLYAVTCRYLWVADPFCNLVVLDSSRATIAVFDDVSVQSPVAVNPITHRLYYARESAPGLAVVDTRTNKYLGSISLNGRWPSAIDIDLAANRVFVIAEGVRLAVIDAHTSKVLLNKPIARSWKLAVDPFRRQVYLSQFTDTNTRGYLAIFDSNTLRLKTKIQVGIFPTDVVADILSGFVFVSSHNAQFSVINGNNLKLRKTIFGPTGPIAVNPYTRMVYTGTITDYTEPIVGRVDVLKE